MYQSIAKLMEGMKTEILNEYRAKGLKASGNFERRTKVTRIQRKVVLTMPFYSQYITAFKSNRGGRGPGLRPPIENIIEWLQAKKLPLRDWTTGQFTQRTPRALRQTAFLISRKIGIEGTDIYKGKRKPIDLDSIIKDQLDYAGEEIADRIIQEVKI